MPFQFWGLPVTGCQIASLSAHPGPASDTAVLIPRPDCDAAEGLGFHGALLRRASGFTFAFYCLTEDSRQRLLQAKAPSAMAHQFATLLGPVLQGATPLVIPDLRADERAGLNPLVINGPHLRSFVGLPLVTASGDVLGMVCVADPRLRPVTQAQLASLRRLADEIALRVEMQMIAPQPAPHSEIGTQTLETTTSCGGTDTRHTVSAMLMQWRDTFSAKWPQTDEYIPKKVVTSIKSRHNLGKIEAIRRNVRETAGSRVPRDKGASRPEGERAVASRLSGAILRTIFVMALVAAPSALLPGVTKDAQQMAALVALFAGAMTFVEYNATYPGLIEFRHAPPFNRIRFALLAATVLVLCVIERGKVEPTALTQFLDAVGSLVGWSMDFPYSPVRLATMMLDNAATSEQIAVVRTAAGMAFLITMVTLIWFVLTMRAGSWPSRRAAFNVWVNLPTFDPTVGADIIRRLDRDARVNVALGFLLPFLIPAVVRIASSGLEPLALTAPQTLVWTVTIWAFLPASLFMRGIAMARVAQMIREKRQAAAIGASDGLLPA